MARYTNAVCKLCRREGMKLFLKGDRCFTVKCAVEKRNYPPGEHGQRRPEQEVDVQVGQEHLKRHQQEEPRRPIGPRVRGRLLRHVVRA